MSRLHNALSAVVSVTDEELEQIQDWVRLFWDPDEISGWQLITDTLLFGVVFLLVYLLSS